MAIKIQLTTINLAIKLFTMVLTGEFHPTEIRQIMKKKYFFFSLKIKKWQFRFQPIFFSSLKIKKLDFFFQPKNKKMAISISALK